MTRLQSIRNQNNLQVVNYLTYPLDDIWRIGQNYYKFATQFSYELVCFY
jgi:hypothetical protein